MSTHATPDSLKYTNEHEWALIEGNMATIGITDFAQSALGDVVFLELPEIGKQLSEGDTFGVVESIKSVSDLYSPLSGEVVETNTDLEDSPENFNSAPYDSWIIKIKISEPEEVANLMNSKDYQDFCASL